MYKKLLPLYIIFLGTLLTVQAEKKAVKATGDNVDPTCGCPYTIEEQNEKKFEAEEELTVHADTLASFRGGETALINYEERLIQNPAKDASDSAKYSILCRFVVEHDGSISHTELLSHSDKIFESEALRFMETMPKWIPAKKDKKPIRSWHSVRLFFGYQKQDDTASSK